jgi:predicted transcriptional regulator of viral defense system
MKFENLIVIIGKQPFFDLTTVIQLSGDKKETVKAQLYRWAKTGKIISLRRGMYAFAEAYRRCPLNLAELANLLYRPSYLSLEWALSFYGLIPEKVVMFTSVTTRVPRSFHNAVGQFRYANVKKAFFGGYKSAEIMGRKILLAEPEKALLDMWHLEKGEWDKIRMTEMRFQNVDLINYDKLEEFAYRINSPRLNRAVVHWRQVGELCNDGTVTI